MRTYGCALLALLFFGCTEDPLPERPNPLEGEGIPFALIRDHVSSGGGYPDALLSQHVVVKPGDTNAPIAEYIAYFTHDRDWTLPNEVHANRQELILQDNRLSRTVTKSALTPSIDWSVTGYAGESFEQTGFVVSKITFTNHVQGDTIVREDGVTLKYDGWHGGLLVVEIMSGSGPTYYMDDDDGEVFIPASSLPSKEQLESTADELRLGLTHWHYTVERSPNGKQIALYSDHSAGLRLHVRD